MCLQAHGACGPGQGWVHRAKRRGGVAGPELHHCEGAQPLYSLHVQGEPLRACERGACPTITQALSLNL